MSNLLLARSKRRARDAFNGTALRQEWAKTDSEGKLSVSGGTLVCAGGKAVPAWDDPRLTWTKPQRARAGLTFECEMTWTAFGTGVQFGLDVSSPVVGDLTPSFYVDASGVLRAFMLGGTNAATPVTLALGTSYRFRIILLGTHGVLWLSSADGGVTWLPVWQSSTAASGTLYAGYDSRNATWTSQYLRVFQGSVPVPALSDTFAARTSPGRADTGQPWLTVTTKPLPVIAGDFRAQVGQPDAWLQAWSGVSDGIWEADVNFGSGASGSRIALLVFRFRDVLNHMRVQLDRGAQAIVVTRFANSVNTTVGSLAAAGWADSTTYRFRVVAVGSTIKVYQDGVEKVSVSEPFGQYFALCGPYVLDGLLASDIRMDTLKVWGTPARPLLMDSFDRPDTLNDTARADSGQAYSRTGDLTPFTSTWGIASGTAYCASRTSGDGTHWTPLAQASAVMSGILRFNGVTTNLFGPLLRQQDENDWIAVRMTGAGIAVLQMLAGAKTTLTSNAFSPVADRDYLVGAVMLGNAVEVYLDGVRLLSTSATNFPTSPAGGSYAGGSGTTGLHDDLRYYPLGNGALVHDTFTRADSATTLGSTELPGTAWTARFSSTWGISTNQAYCAVAALGTGITVPVLARDVDMQCDLTRQAAVIGLLARLGGAGTDYLLIQFDSTTCKVRERVAPGAVADISATPYAWATSGTARTVRVRVFQGLVSVYVNEVLVVATPFSGHAGATEIDYGLYNSDASLTTSRFDNFSVKEVTA